MKTFETFNNLESELKQRGFKIEPVEFAENETQQCEKCCGQDCFKFYDKGWFIEGEFYCESHKQDALAVLQQVAEGAKKIQRDREETIRIRGENSGL
ncbi:MAG: hypothetical protein V1846_03940 [Candidatus Komeilibacteria bacterium]